MTFGVNSRTGGGGNTASLFSRPTWRPMKFRRTGLFERLALDRNNLRCQGQLPPVRGGNDGGSDGYFVSGCNEDLFPQTTYPLESSI